jgi:uncharacterized BrkB/YihY/UPF0761 family membrane protein
MAVAKKYGEDQGGQRAALLAYYGFFSLFPLLLVAVTVIGFVLHGHTDLGQRNLRHLRPGHRPAVMALPGLDGDLVRG